MESALGSITNKMLHLNPCLNLLAHSSVFKGKNSRHKVITIWLCVVWLLWKQRNAIIFEGVEFSIDKTVDELKARLWS
ncbi:hypothetical protein ACS0TY_009035 [Phlomoides rotata]